MNDEIKTELTVAYLARKKNEARKINKGLSSILVPAETVEVAYQHPQMYKQLLNGEINPRDYAERILEEEGVPVVPTLLDSASARYEITGSLALAEKEGTDPLEYWLFEDGQDELLKEIYTPEGYRQKLENWLEDLTGEGLEQYRPDFVPEPPQRLGPLVAQSISMDLESEFLTGKEKSRELDRFIKRQQQRIFG